MVLTLTGQTVALRSDKPFVTTEDSARIELTVLDDAGRPVRDAQVSLTANVGSVTEPTPAQEGTFSATYRPASQDGAQVALLHATVKRGASSSGAWLALPVHGPYRLRVQAPARSRVQVSIGAASYGPVTATASKEALVPVNLPPGAESAQVTIIERSGKRRTQAVPLPPPRFARVQLVALESPIQGRAVRLQGFVVDDSGNPAVALPALTVSAEQGALGPIEPKEGGVFEVPYTASAAGGAPVSLSASTAEEPERASTLQVEPLSAPPGSQAGPGQTGPGNSVANTAPLSTHSQRPVWQPTLGLLLFVHSNTASANGLGLQLEGSLRLGQLPLELLGVLEARGNGEVEDTIDGPIQVKRKFTLTGGGARIGARWLHLFLSRGTLFASASAGILSMGGKLKLESTEGKFDRDVRSNGPAASLGAGLAWPLGPGRVCGQLQWTFAPGRGQVSGNLGGMSLGAGYQLSFGGGQTP